MQINVQTIHCKNNAIQSLIALWLNLGNSISVHTCTYIVNIGGNGIATSAKTIKKFDHALLTGTEIFAHFSFPLKSFPSIAVSASLS